MSVIDFIANNKQLVGLVVTTIGSLIWHRNKQFKLNDLWDTATKLGHEALVALLKDPNLYDDAYVRAKLNSAVWTGLSRLGVKRSQALETLVDEVVVHLKGELAEQLWKANLGKFIEVQQQTAGTLKEATAP